MRIIRSLQIVIGCLWMWIATSNSLLAQPKPSYSPSTTHIFPAGGRAGTTVSVRVGTECAPPGAEFRIFGAGLDTQSRLTKELPVAGEPSVPRKPTEIPVTYPREWAAEIRIPDNSADQGAYWRVSCAQGGTGSRPFVIGTLPEFIESESNSTTASAEAVALPVTVNGQICGERDIDYYRFRAAAGEVVSCEVLAGRLGSPLDPVVELLDASGRPARADRLHVGSDPVLVFRSPTSSEYILRIANVSHRGDASCVYRINLVPQAFPRFALPGGIRPGATAELEVFGVAGDGEYIRQRQTFSGSGNAPASAAGTLAQMGSVALAHDLFPSFVEIEPNGSAAEAKAIAFPAVVYGQFATADDNDQYRIQSSSGTPLRLECRAWPPGTPAMPHVRVTDSTGERVVANAVTDTEDGTVRLNWTAPRDGECLIDVRDVRFGSRGGQDFCYRLLIQNDQRDFELLLPADAITVPQGKDASIEVKVRRHGGFEAAIPLDMIGLPEGVSVENALIPEKQTSAKIKFVATETARSASSVLRIVGRCSIDGNMLERTATCMHLGVDSEGVSVGLPTIDRLHLTVQHKPVFRLYCTEAYEYAHRGSIYPYFMEIERLDGFEGEVHIQRGDRQNRDMDGIEFLDVAVPPGVTRVPVPIYLPETMAINVQSQSQLYAQGWTTFTDSFGAPQSVLVLSEKRNMLRTHPPVVKLRASESTIHVRPGERKTLRFELERTSNFPGPMQLNLQDCSVPGAMECPAVTIPAGATACAAEVAFASARTDATHGEPVRMKFRATGLMRDTTVVTETEMLVRFD